MPRQKGFRHSEETKQKMSKSHTGIGARLGYRHSEEVREKMSEIRKKDPNRYWLGKHRSEETKGKLRKFFTGLIGEKNNSWIKDRTQLVKRQERNDSAYCGWRLAVYRRDNFKCKIANQDCDGRIEAHHILGWMEFVELRYEINNGITLCRAHHPKKRAEEKRLIPMFSELVSVSK